MNEIFSSEEMKRFEHGQFSKRNSYTFMQKAGSRVFEFISNNFKNKRPIILLCGPGNNGGDGFVIARHLMDHGYVVEVYIFARKIIADCADEMGLGEKTRSNGCVAGGSAKQAWVFRARGFD